MLNVFIFSFFSSIIFTWLTIRIAKRFKILDYPSERKVHTDPTPLLGGVAIYIAYMLALLLNFHFSWELKGIVIAASFILLLGVMDDIKEFSALGRLFIQVACAFLVVSFGVDLNVIPQTVSFHNEINILITIIWIVGITNAMNFIDGLDGLACGITAIASGTFFIIAYQTGQNYFAFLNIALLGACLGFLLFNFKPAKIFLGDAGSSFLGFSIASLAVMGEWAEKSPVVALSIPLLTLAVLIFDVVYISVSRIAKKQVKNFEEWIEYVGKDHLHHRLVAMGFTKVQTVLFIYLISMVFAIAALVLKKATTYQATLLVIQGVFVLVIIAGLMIVGQKHIDESKTL